jgi:two-component system chemotaxis sensor kinase CheA
VDTARYAELFLTESQDNLSAINHALLELERTPNAREPVGALFRAVHTVKGMSATMGYVAVAELSHELETLLDLVRRGQREVTASLMDTLFSAADMLERAVELSVGGRGDELDIAPTIAALRVDGPAAVSSAAAAVGEPVTKTRKKRSTKGRGAGAPAATVTVLVRMEPNTPMPGVRAYLAIERARTLGTVVRTTPAQGAARRRRLRRDDHDRPRQCRT